MTTLEQHHSGIGDNVAGDKIILEIKSLAPDDLISSIDLVLESLRKKDHRAARIQMGMLKVIAQREAEAAALVEVISIYSGLVEAQDHDAAWTTVAKTFSTSSNLIVKDMCLAALLKLSSSSGREVAARELFENEPSHGPYARETYLRLYASNEQLEEAGKGNPPEAELTGIVEGASRLNLTDLMMRMAMRLNTLYPSYNSRVLLAIATGLELNPDLERCHLWLNRPDVKERLDDLADHAAQLLEQSQGTDPRVQNLACSIANIYQGYAPVSLFEMLKKYLQNLDSAYSESIAIFKIFAGDDAVLSESQRNLKAACENQQKRTDWCRQFLKANSHSIEEVMSFLRLAIPSELKEWLSHEHIIDGASEMENAYARLVAQVLQHDGDEHNVRHQHEQAEHVDDFISRWGNDIASIMPEVILELAEKLIIHKLPHKALEFTSRLIPNDTLWPSQFVVTHLRCLLETEQYETFEQVVTRVKGAEKSVMILNLQSLEAERIGDIDAALKFSDLMVEYAPEMAYAWNLGCYLRARHRSLNDQQSFHQRIPDAVLQNPIPEVISILKFLTKAGNFKRAEPLWVQWFLQAPRARAVDLVNFHFSMSHSDNFHVSQTLEQCAVAIEYEQEGNTHIRLIVENDHQDSGEYTLKSSSQLGKLLQSLAEGDSANLGMTTYKVIKRLPPYVGCFRIALKLRHTHNDGSDCFAMMQLPSDPTEMVHYLEEKLAQNSDSERKQLEVVDSLPLYMRGHALNPNKTFKGALSCWSDVRIPKSPLWSQGEANPNAIVLDAYSIGYLASTDLVQRLLESGISLVLPAATKEMLEHFINDISDDDFMSIGLTDNGRLYRTTASDIREHDAHIFEALRLIRDRASVAYPMVRNVQLEIFSIRDAIDTTVYDAIQLSTANNIPWFCMDNVFASLHHVNKNPTVNVSAIVLQALSREKFDFERMRHGFLLYAIGAIPFAFTFKDLFSLAATPNPLAGFILFQLIKNHGRKIFAEAGRTDMLLDIILLHLHSRYTFGGSLMTMWPRYTPWQIYTNHVFNHGLSLYLSFGEGCAELRLAKAMNYMSLRIREQQLWKNICGRFVGFAKGHFMNLKAVAEYSSSIIAEPLKDETINETKGNLDV